MKSGFQPTPEKSIQTIRDELYDAFIVNGSTKTMTLKLPLRKFKDVNNYRDGDAYLSTPDIVRHASLYDAERAKHFSTEIAPILDAITIELYTYDYQVGPTEFVVAIMDDRDIRPLFKLIDILNGGDPEWRQHIKFESKEWDFSSLSFPVNINGKSQLTEDDLLAVWKALNLRFGVSLHGQGKLGDIFQLSGGIHGRIKLADTDFIQSMSGLKSWKAKVLDEKISDLIDESLAFYEKKGKDHGKK